MPNLNAVCVLGRVMPIQGRGIVGCPECGGPQLWLEGVIVRGDVVVPVLLPLWAVYLGQDGLGKELPPPSMASSPADPLESGSSQIPSVLRAHPIPQCKAGGPERCLLPQLSSGMPGLWFQGTQLTSPHRQWPRTAVTSSPLSQESQHNPTPPSPPPCDPPTPG